MNATKIFLATLIVSVTLFPNIAQCQIVLTFSDGGGSTVNWGFSGSSTLTGSVGTFARPEFRLPSNTAWSTFISGGNFDDSGSDLRNATNVITGTFVTSGSPAVFIDGTQVELVGGGFAADGDWEVQFNDNSAGNKPEFGFLSTGIHDHNYPALSGTEELSATGSGSFTLASGTFTTNFNVGTYSHTATSGLNTQIIVDPDGGGPTGPTPPEARAFAWNEDFLGDWANNGNWSIIDGGSSPSVRANNPNHTVAFPDTASITGPTHVSTAAAVTVNRIEFANAAHSFLVGGFGSVNLHATTDPNSPVNPSMSVAGTHQFQAIVNLHNDTAVNVGSNSVLSFNNALNLGGATLTKTGVGEMEINNQLTTAGGSINIQQGTVSGHGTIGGNVNNDGGTISPGSDSAAATSLVPEPGSWTLLLLGLMALVSTIRPFRRY